MLSQAGTYRSAEPVRKARHRVQPFRGSGFSSLTLSCWVFFLLDGAKVERRECQKVAGDIFSATE